MSQRVCLAMLVVALAACGVAQDDMVLSSGHAELGVVGQRAPTWHDVTWHGAGARGRDVAEYRGKVLVLYAFQSWCPGCHSRGFPTLAALEKRYAAHDDVAFVAVQTTFEGFAANSPERGLDVVESFELAIPVGQSGAEGKRSAFMRDYRTGGTPWTILIDKTGVVRFNDFFLDEKLGARWIDRMLAEDPIIDAPLPELAFDGWARERASVPDDAPPKRATLYRWWTRACPFCEASLPILETLAEKYADAGVEVVGVFHPKPRLESLAQLDRDEVRANSNALGFSGPIALDLDHSELQRVYLGRVEGAQATSITVLVDAAGVIRHVDPGPLLERVDGGEGTRLEQELRRVLELDTSR